MSPPGGLSAPAQMGAARPEGSAGEPGAEWVDVTTLGDLLVRAAWRDPDAKAVVFPDATQTYRQLLTGALEVSRGLMALGIQPGDHVGILMANSLELLHTLFGAALVGAVVIPVNSRFRTHELGYVVRHADLRVVVTSHAAARYADHPARLAEALPAIADAAEPAALGLSTAPALQAVVALGEGEDRPGFVGAEQFAALAGTVTDEAVERRRARVRVRDVAVILYTSGTTANPKGCVHTHEALVRNGMVTGRTRFFLTRQDRFWDPLPMFHVGFLLPMIAAMDAGAAILTMSHLDGGEALDMMEREQATWLFPAFTAVANTFLDHPSFISRDLTRVRMTMSVGPPKALRDLQAAVPSAVQISTYGSTETGGVITYHLPSDTPEQRATTSGTPFRGIELRILRLSGPEEAAPGEIGEILVRGYSIMDGYYKDPVATAAAIDGEGWLHTGDLGSIGEDGHITYHGRLKDMLKVGGENVSAAEVEAVISECPGVGTVQVVGAEDERLDEVVAAFIERTPGAGITERDIIDFCRPRIAAFKVPRHVRFVEAWPMSATKIQKQALRDRLRAELRKTAAPSSP